MVEVDQAALDRDMRRFANNVALKALFIGKAASKVLQVECRRLAETLIRITPPTSGIGAMKRKIEDDVSRTFFLLGAGDAGDMEGKFGGWTVDSKFRDITKKRGSGDVKWLLWTSHVLIGITEDYDLRKATVDGLKQIHYETEFTPSGKTIRGQRGKQKVLVIQKHLTKRSTVRKLIAKLQANVGKLKAGWLVGWKATGGDGAGRRYSPPDWVTRHEKKSYLGGADITQIDDPTLPAVRIWNTAKNASTPYMRGIASNALGIRMEAMPKHVANLLKVQARDQAGYEAAIEKEFAE